MLHYIWFLIKIYICVVWTLAVFQWLNERIFWSEKPGLKILLQFMLLSLYAPHHVGAWIKESFNDIFEENDYGTDHR